MAHIAPFAALISGLVLLLALSPWGTAEGCDICGRECMGSCGDTRSFATCCYNYLRKRGAAIGVPAPDGPIAAILAAAAELKNNRGGAGGSGGAEGPRRPAFAFRPAAAVPLAQLAPLAVYDD